MWSTDVCTSIRMMEEFVYLVAGMDWFQPVRAELRRCR